MEYLKPLETLQNQNTFYKKVIIGMLGLILFAFILVEKMHKDTPLLILDNGEISRIMKSSPREETISRLEGFTKHYLSSRFEWNKDNFKLKMEIVKNITDPKVFKKMQSSLGQFESLSLNQNARSFYVYEGFGFSNKERKIETRITKVLRIGSAAAVLPLIIRFSYSDTSVNETNPYGLVITAIEESEAEEIKQIKE